MATRTRASHRLLAGFQAESQGRNEQARDRYLEALAMDPHLAEAHARLIRVFLELGDRDKALEHYSATRRLSEQPADAHAYYGLLLFREDRFQEAEAAFELALGDNPYHPDALAHLGRLREQNKDLQEAERLYRAAIECRENYREARLFLAGLLVGERRYQEAFAQCDKLLAVEDEKTARFLIEISHLYTVAGDRTETIRSLQRAYEVAERFGQSEVLDELARMGLGRR